MWIDEGYHGHVKLNPDNSISGTVYKFGKNTSFVSLVGHLTPQITLQFNLVGPGRPNPDPAFANSELVKDEGYQAGYPTPLQLAAATYQSARADQTSTITIRADGTFDIVEGECTFGGKLTDTAYQYKTVEYKSTSAKGTCVMPDKATVVDPSLAMVGIVFSTIYRINGVEHPSFMFLGRSPSNPDRFGMTRMYNR